MQDIKTVILLFLAFTIICGGIYPVIVTGIAQAIFPHQANASLIADKNGQVIGSALIGQPFSDPKYFWPRPSASGEFGYNPLASGGSNAGPTNPDYLKVVAERVKMLRAGGVIGPIPADLVQASASGLDPHLTPEAVAVQIARVAKVRGLAVESVAQLVAQTTEERQFGLLGGARVNVLALNLALDNGSP